MINKMLFWITCLKWFSLLKSFLTDVRASRYKYKKINHQLSDLRVFDLNNDSYHVNYTYHNLIKRIPKSARAVQWTTIVLFTCQTLIAFCKLK